MTDEQMKEVSDRFKASIPPGTEINGIVVEVERPPRFGDGWKPGDGFGTVWRTNLPMADWPDTIY